MKREPDESAHSGRGWEHFDHGADIGVRGFGVSVEEAFAQAAVALTAVVTEPDLVQANERIDIDCGAPDLELLLVAWLNAVIYEMAVRNMLFCRFHVAIQQQDGQAQQLHGELDGEAVDLDRHQPSVEVKGATVTELRVFQDANSRWVAQCIVDV